MKGCKKELRMRPYRFFRGIARSIYAIILRHFVIVVVIMITLILATVLRSSTVRVSSPYPPMELERNRQGSAAYCPERASARRNLGSSALSVPLFASSALLVHCTASPLISDAVLGAVSIVTVCIGRRQYHEL